MAMKPAEEITQEKAAAHTSEELVSSNLSAGPVSTEAEVYLSPPVMTMEEIEEKLGFGYALPSEEAFSGTIVSKFDDSLGENGGILLEYTFDGFTVYAIDRSRCSSKTVASCCLLTFY